MSDTARDFIRRCLTINQKERLTAAQALDHAWLASDTEGVVNAQGQPRDLLPNMRANFDARKTFRKAIWSVRFAVNQPHGQDAQGQQIRTEAEGYKTDAQSESVAHGMEVLA